MKSLARALPAINLKGASIETVGKINPGALFGSGKIDEIHKKIVKNQYSNDKVKNVLLN